MNTKNGTFDNVLQKSLDFFKGVRNVLRILGNKFWLSPWKGSQITTFPSKILKILITKHSYTPWGYTYRFSSKSNNNSTIYTILTSMAKKIQLFFLDTRHFDPILTFVNKIPQRSCPNFKKSFQPSIHILLEGIHTNFHPNWTIT